MTRRSLPLVAAALVTVGVLAGCGAGPTTRPDYAVNTHAAGEAPSATPTLAATGPALEAPTTDLSWADCTSTTFAAAGVVAPADFRVDCAQFPAPLGTTGKGTLNLAAVKLSTSATPADAAPLVLTVGSDETAASALISLASGPASSLVRSRAVVALDRRGVGGSTPITCREPEQTGAMHAQAQVPGLRAPGADAVAALSSVATAATVACTDVLDPHTGDFTVGHAASDLEALRTVWGVPALAVWGVGDGAAIALNYAAAYPDHVARVVLDSPSAANAGASGIGQEQAAEQRAKAAEKAFADFAAECRAVTCSLGPDPAAAVTDVLARARSGALPSLTYAEVVRALSTALAYRVGDRVTAVTRLSDVFAAARTGNVAPLATASRAAATATDSDGMFVARCSDVTNRATTDRVTALAASWATQYPTFGLVAALSLMDCSAWPTPAPSVAIDSIRGPVLVLGGTSDPVSGTEGLAATATAVSNAGGRAQTISSDGIGHGVLLRSSCAVPVTAGYLTSGLLPERSVSCPA